MSYKRFECVFKEHETKNSWSMIKDNQLDKPLYIKDVVDLLNEQQATIEAKDKEIEESKITIQLYETDVSMRDNFLKSKGLYDEFLQCLKEGGIIE